MIIEIFIILLFLSIILIFAGRYTEAPPLQLAGYLFLFVLGLVMLSGNVFYVSGQNEINNYACGCCNEGVFNQGGSTYDYFCIGTPLHCDYYDLNELDCIASGCSYDNETLSCFGNPQACDTFTEQRTCELVNCTWAGEPSLNACVNSTLIISNVTTTKIYSGFSDEIISGVNLNHVFGLFLSIIVVLGWIIVFFNLKSMNDEDKIEYERE